MILWHWKAHVFDIGVALPHASNHGSTVNYYWPVTSASYVMTMIMGSIRIWVIHCCQTYAPAVRFNLCLANKKPNLTSVQLQFVFKTPKSKLSYISCTRILILVNSMLKNSQTWQSLLVNFLKLLLLLKQSNFLLVGSWQK